MADLKTSAQLLKAWHNGLSLGAALELFDPNFDRAELAEKRRSRLQMLDIGRRNFEKAGMTGFEQMVPVLNRFLSHLSGGASALQSREFQLIEALENGDLAGLGYPVARPKAKIPEVVPQFLIQLQFANFRKSEFSDGEHGYSKVRVVAPDALPKPKIGRPSVGNLIIELASDLERTKRIKRDMPPKAQGREIRKAGQRQFPDKFSDNSPSDQTIMRHLKSFWSGN
jgi:hypothetical protein